MPSIDAVHCRSKLEVANHFHPNHSIACAFRPYHCQQACCQSTMRTESCWMQSRLSLCSLANPELHTDWTSLSLLACHTSCFCQPTGCHAAFSVLAISNPLSMCLTWAHIHHCLRVVPVDTMLKSHLMRTPVQTGDRSTGQHTFPLLDVTSLGVLGA